MRIEEFIGDSVYYDYNGQMIFGTEKHSNKEQHLLDVRGWGAIHTNQKIDNPEKFQDDLGIWIAEAINERLKRVRTIKD